MVKKTERKYLARTSIETAWDTDSDKYKQLLSTGIPYGTDGDMIKGFKSLPADANIALIKVKRIPLLHPVLIEQHMCDRFSKFGHVLDLGFYKDRAGMVGNGYVVLDRTTTKKRSVVEIPFAE